MAKNSYLDGENIRPRNTMQAKAMMGASVNYLHESDIDKSGRGYFWPRQGKITGVFNGRIDFDDRQLWYSIRDIREMSSREVVSG